MVAITLVSEAQVEDGVDGHGFGARNHGALAIRLAVDHVPVVADEQTAPGRRSCWMASSMARSIAGPPEKVCRRARYRQRGDRNNFIVLHSCELS